MKNLAGREDCDKFIEEELTKCGIELIRLPARLRSEVPASIIGRLGKFQFHRAWYYWVVQGLMPLEVAQELYADPVGKTDVRIKGHCGCPPPEERWITWLGKNGKRLLLLKERAEAVKVFEKRKDLLERFLSEFDFSENPSVEGEAFIDSYHIDSELGLRIFADALKKHNLV